MNKFKQEIEALNDSLEFGLTTKNDEWEKWKGICRPGLKVGWYYKEDLDFVKERGQNEESLKKYPPFKGFLVPTAGKEMRYSFDSEDDMTENWIVIGVEQPTEKDYPECEWVALNRLLNCEWLVEIFELP